MQITAVSKLFLKQNALQALHGSSTCRAVRQEAIVESYHQHPRRPWKAPVAHLSYLQVWIPPVVLPDLLHPFIKGAAQHAQRLSQQLHNNDTSLLTSSLSMPPAATEQWTLCTPESMLVESLQQGNLFLTRTVFIRIDPFLHKVDGA